MGEAPAPTPDVAASVQVSRGVEASVVPSWVGSGPARRAAEFVRVAATADTRVDEVPEGAWRRAKSMMTPALVADLEAGSALGQVAGWGRLQRLDGWVSVEFGNVLGDEPQAAPGPEDSPTPKDGVEIEVVFTRTIHAEGQRDVRESEPLVWVVRVVGDQVAGVSTVTTTNPG
ncbi:MAG: hypothetical protein Q4D96_03610 [Propionibacteriaceae bacterium]|nr:hypothetical protein [Propionibacteriaceae bacterium]